MTPEAFRSWLRAWLSAHPWHAPDPSTKASYTDQVMRRVHSLPRSRPAASVSTVGWWRRPRLVLAFSGAAAVALLAVTVVGRPSAQLSRRIDRDLHVLAAVGETPEDATALSTDALEDALRSADHLVVAEATPAADDEAWIDRTTQLLTEVDALSDDSSTGSPSEDWLQEFKTLDETELATS